MHSYFVKPFWFREVSIKCLLLLAAYLVVPPLALSSWAAEDATPVIDTVLLEGITDADAYGCELVDLIKKKIKEKGRQVVKVRIIWVSPDNHPSPKLEAVMRLVHLGLQPPDAPAPVQVIEDVHYTPEEFNSAMETGRRESIEDFETRLLLAKTMLYEGGTEAPRRVTVSYAERHFLVRLFNASYVQMMHALGVPNGFEIRKYFNYRSIPPRKRLLVNLSVTALQLALQYAIGEHYLRDRLGDGFLPAMTVSAIATVYFGIFSESRASHSKWGTVFRWQRSPTPRK